MFPAGRVGAQCKAGMHRTRYVGMLLVSGWVFRVRQAKEISLQPPPAPEVTVRPPAQDLQPSQPQAAAPPTPAPPVAEDPPEASTQLPPSAAAEPPEASIRPTPVTIELTLEQPPTAPSEQRDAPQPLPELAEASGRAPAAAAAPPPAVQEEAQDAERPLTRTEVVESSGDGDGAPRLVPSSERSRARGLRFGDEADQAALDKAVIEQMGESGAPD